MSAADAGGDIDARLAERKSQLDRLRPLSGKTLAALAAWYDVELTYTSNAIEGNTLTRVETAIVLEKGMAVSGKPGVRLRATTPPR